MSPEPHPSSISSSLQMAMDDLLPRIEEELYKALETPHPALQRFYGMMQYHLGWVDEAFRPVQASGGKRVRPLLCLLTAYAAGGDTTPVLPAAAAIELLHNFSLIHDDIEDNDRTRRHRPTVWALWGRPQAINVGDGMFSLAFLTMSRLHCTGLPGSRIGQAMLAFQEACLTLTEGQFLDMSFEEQKHVDRDDYLWMIHNKTASLIAASARIGAILAGSEPAVVSAYREFASALGMTFQIRDDILGIWGEPSHTGKPAGGDICRKKKSLPLVIASEKLLQTGEIAMLSSLHRMYQQPSLVAKDIDQVLHILEAVQARVWCEELAMHYQGQAMAHLHRAGAGPATNSAAWDCLRELSLFLLDRTC